MHLPGLRPRHTSLKITVEDDTTITVRVWQGDAQGFVRASEETVYDLLTDEEAGDVLDALLDGLGLYPRG